MRLVSAVRSMHEVRMYDRRTRSLHVLAVVAGAVSALSLAGADAVAGGSRQGGGALSQATGAVRSVVGPPPSTGSGGGSSPSGSGYTPPPTYTYHPEYGPASCVGCGPVVARPAPASQGPVTPVRVSLGLGLHSVEDSDGALVGGVRATLGRFGVDFDGARYIERVPALDGSDSIHMNVWSLGAMLRAFGEGPTAIWLSGGVTGASSSEFQSMVGPVVGIELSHELTRDLVARAGARYLMFDQDMYASELRAAVRASFLSVGYRVFQFEVGPPLRGPEVGVALRF